MWKGNDAGGVGDLAEAVEEMIVLGLFRRIFHPTKEEQINDLEMLLKRHEEQIGHCTTCKKHISSHEPGFVTDFGKCKNHSTIFAQKACGLTDAHCPLYEEDVEEVVAIKRSILELRQLEPKEVSRVVDKLTMAKMVSLHGRSLNDE